MKRGVRKQPTSLWRLRSNDHLVDAIGTIAGAWWSRRSSRIFSIVRALAGFSRASPPNGRTTNGRTFRLRSSSSGRRSDDAGAGPSASLRLRAPGEPAV
jgi:hypothetical protein